MHIFDRKRWNRTTNATPSSQQVALSPDQSLDQIEVENNNQLNTTKKVRVDDEQVSIQNLWMSTARNVLPLFIISRVAFALLTFLAPLFTLGDFSPTFISDHIVLRSWEHWDTGHFTSIAEKGYDRILETAFFPLYPFLMKLFSFAIKPYYSGLLISNLAAFGVMVVLYRLVTKDFDTETAGRAVIYQTLFPSAFFLAAAYNESTFLFLALCCFYCIRQGLWWRAGLFGLLASLTRSAGLFLFVPFAYEYLRQHDFNWKKFRPDLLAGLGIPLGIGLFGTYCYVTLNDFLAFSHAQARWHRSLKWPWEGVMTAAHSMQTHHLFSFDTLHNAIDISSTLLMLGLIVLCFVGPWRFSKERLSYALYALTVYVFLILVPAVGNTALQSMTRLVMEIFPALIMLAQVGKRPDFHLGYVVISTCLLSFLLLQFLSGHWMV